MLILHLKNSVFGTIEFFRKLHHDGAIFGVSIGFTGHCRDFGAEFGLFWSILGLILVHFGLFGG